MRTMRAHKRSSAVERHHESISTSFWGLSAPISQRNQSNALSY
jgi:hypothetical protein